MQARFQSFKESKRVLWGVKNEVEKVAGRRFAAYLIDFNLFTLPPPHFLISTCVNTHTRKLKRAPGGLSRNRKVNNKCTLGLCIYSKRHSWCIGYLERASKTTTKGLFALFRDLITGLSYAQKQLKVPLLSSSSCLSESIFSTFPKELRVPKRFLENRQFLCQLIKNLW